VLFIIELINYLWLVCPPCLSDNVTINNHDSCDNMSMKLADVTAVVTFPRKSEHF
jgi:hypothetical protein